MINRLLVPSIACLLLAGAPVAKAVPPVYTLQTGVGSDGVVEDSFFHVTGSALFSKGLSRKGILNLTAELASFHYSDDDGNSAEKLFLQGEYRYTPRAGFSVPTYAVALRQQERYKKDSDYDSETSLLFSVSYRIDDRSSVLGGLRFSENPFKNDVAKNDTSELGYFVNFDYLADNNWLLYTSLVIASSETDSTLRTGSRLASKAHLPGEPGFVGSSTTSTSTTTTNINPSSSSNSGETFDSDDLFLRIGASYGIDSNSSIDMAIEQQSYDTEGVKVSGNVLTFDYFYRF